MSLDRKERLPMGDWTFGCWHCGTQTQMQQPVRRQDACARCLSDMHACKNCRFYSSDAHNQCAEPMADYTPDKERSNFCGLFEPSVGQKPKMTDIDAAKARLESLFRKA